MYHIILLYRKDLMTRKGLVVFVFQCYRGEKIKDTLNQFFCVITGVTVDNTLAGIRVSPELYPQTSKKVPDVNFYYRYLYYL